MDRPLFLCLVATSLPFPLCQVAHVTPRLTHVPAAVGRPGMAGQERKKPGRDAYRPEKRLKELRFYPFRDNRHGGFEVHVGIGLLSRVPPSILPVCGALDSGFWTLHSHRVPAASRQPQVRQGERVYEGKK
ncbi:hypothetical protein E2C01_067736 [Portunus trituberculatus]|uniref:Uncharacterized protein n=1 Tax=Portunus trituberculatus TaxID=210409 RepID=A0A5B7HXJ0_PORTR|nr:hypothetical protein [Portunus trituberculatus]